MSEEVSRRAFEPFFTTRAAEGGTGLGLSMVDGFARQCGGAVSIASIPGQGTSARIYLPVADPAVCARDD
jgi:signal transduction histidine kinase